MFSYVKLSSDEALPQLIAYAENLRLVDTYWEYYVRCDGEINDIYANGTIVGFFCIHTAEQLLSAFYIHENCLCLAQTIFKDILTRFAPKSAFVVTSDEFFLSILSDHASDNGLKFQSEAYFFDEVSDVELQEKYSNLKLIQADVCHISELQNLDFFDNLAVDDESDVKYLLYDGDDLLGAGHIQTMVLSDKYGAIGMVTAPEHRNKGVGSAIILLEKQICKSRGLIPIAGCWYYNYASKRTLEACGFASKTRLLRVVF